MPFALVLIGLVLIVTGSKDTYRELGAELVSDFTGDNNFTYWIASVGAVGSLGYVPQLRTFSRLFMTLIILAMLISNRGFFAKLSEALNSGPVSTTPTPRAGNDNGANTPESFTDSLSDSITRISAQSNSKAQENFGKVLNAAKLLFMA